MKTKKLSVLMTLVAITGTLSLGIPLDSFSDFAATPLPGGITCTSVGNGFDDDTHSTPTEMQTFDAGAMNTDLEVFLEFGNPSGNAPFTNAGTAWLVDSNNNIVGQGVPLVPGNLVLPMRTFVGTFDDAADGQYNAVLCMILGQQFDPATQLPIYPSNALGAKHSVVFPITIDNEAPDVLCDPLVTVNVLATDLPVDNDFNQDLIDFHNSGVATDAIEGPVPVQDNRLASYNAGDTQVRFFASDSNNNGNPSEGECFGTVRVLVTAVAGCSGLQTPLTSEQICLDVSAVLPFCGMTVFPGTLNLQTVAQGQITPNFIYTIHNPGNAHGRYIAQFDGFIDTGTGNVIIDADNLRFINSNVDTPFANMFEYGLNLGTPVDKVVYRSLAPLADGPVGNKLEVNSNSQTFSGVLGGSVTLMNDLCGDAKIRPTAAQPGDFP